MATASSRQRDPTAAADTFAPDAPYGPSCSNQGSQSLQAGGWQLAQLGELLPINRHGSSCTRCRIGRLALSRGTLPTAASSD